MIKRIAIFGLGYVGLCSAVCFSERGYHVTAIDVDKRRIDALKNGRTPFFEDKLDRYFARSVSNGRLQFSSNVSDAVDSDAFFIAVGTPSSPNGGIDLSQVKSASRDIGHAISRKKDYPLIVVKSTVIPGTSEGVVRRLLEKNSGKKCGEDFGLCTNPEFLREGSAINDTFNPDRIIIGSCDKRSGDALLSFYKNFHGDAMPPTLMTSCTTAELVKYANNAFLAMKVSYINSIARICEELRGVDVIEVAEAIGLDPRIGKRFLEAGPGYGGSCFPKDVRALISFCRKIGFESSLLEAVEDTNEAQAEHIVVMAKQILGRFAGKKVSILGLSFKAGTDDTRESPSLKVIKKLLSRKAKLTVYDPKAIGNARRALGDGVSYASSAKECVKGSDLCIVLTGWLEFARLSPADFSRLMENPRVIDSRRIFDSKKLAEKIQIAAVGLSRHE